MTSLARKRPSPVPGHVGINVTDLHRSVRFYAETFCLEVLHESFEKERRYAFLGRDGKAILTLWEQAVGRFTSTAPGLHHLAFEVASLEELDTFHKHLTRQQIRVRGDGILAHGPGGESGGIFFEDPDGTRLEVFTRESVAHRAPAADAPSCGFF